MHTPGSSVSGYILLLVVQIVFIIIFGFLTDYSKELLPKNGTSVDTDGAVADNYLPKYPHFQDIHVMIFIGFAFLMTFLKRYGFSATGLNLLVGALVIQWAIIMRGCYEMEDSKIPLSLENLIGADIAAAAVLISMGALLGRTTPMQLLVMGIIEIAIFAANEFLQLEVMKIADVGGSITVHAFGAYFGLAVSFILRPTKEDAKAGQLECSSYGSDITAMIGTIFLWIFWPSFNSALVEGAEQERAIINTYLSLAGATVTTFALSALVSHEKKFDMVHVQNATLAGGVAVGSICNLMIHPFGALLVGVIAGVISVLGYRFLTPAMLSNMRLADTCGVNNLHGMPALLSAAFSAIYASLATFETYGTSLTSIFPAMKSIAPVMNTTMTNDTSGDHHEFVAGGFGRSAHKQGAYQLLAVLITVSIAIVGGLSTGLVLKSPMVRQLNKDELHDDEKYWETPVESNDIATTTTVSA
ncbi:ammonium transporter Rh type A isoform X1 [Toxorhynchites rutilus septentrionalis]|uniref:ammonium transporter Rh type A isoform X1 n=1 Tax=Toxorhynchites rutilus septentrionalis TaxID=329112 RepID=UPI00247A04C5|nr:ammonium transporter Rh type A isoform X1 [Toxorhynchites rutilus septentrionalis]